MSEWLSASERIKLATQLVAEFRKQFTQAQYKAVLDQFGVSNNRTSDYLFHILLEDTDDDRIEELGRHFELDVPEKPEEIRDDPAVGASARDIDAYSELVSAETALRDVIRIAVPNWIADLDTEAVAALEAKRTEEDRRRDGIQVSQDLLDYTEIYELQAIVAKHWESIKPILDDKKRTDVYLGIIFDIRNSVSHSRPVFAAERLLLAGAAAQIRNQLSIYRAKADGPHMHYPSIDSARDDGGRTGRLNGDGLRDVDKGSLQDIPRLNVGDEIEFELEATDPRGRELLWVSHSLPHSDVDFKTPFAEATGNRTTIKWTVTEADYGEYRKVQIALRNGGNYHRYKHWDDGAVF